LDIWNPGQHLFISCTATYEYNTIENTGYVTMYTKIIDKMYKGIPSQHWTLNMARSYILANIGMCEWYLPGLLTMVMVCPVLLDP
jgi:hypothetical protein